MLLPYLKMQIRGILPAPGTDLRDRAALPDIFPYLDKYLGIMRIDGLDAVAMFYYDRLPETPYLIFAEDDPAAPGSYDYRPRPRLDIYAFVRRRSCLLAEG